MAPVLSFENVSRSFQKGRRVLNDVSFSMQENEIAGLLGRNGSGKTTLLNMAMGLMFPDTGTVRLFGLSPALDPVEVKKRVGYVSEYEILPRALSIGELIGLHRSLFPKWDDAMERLLRDRFRLSRSARVLTLSKGQARQVALLCAVCHRPDLLILDEPAGGLDAVARREFLEVAVLLLNKEGTVILFASHHLADVERLACRALVLDDGRIWLDRPVDFLRESVCVAIVPRSAAPNREAIERAAGCLRVREVFNDWHVVLEGTPEDAHEHLTQAIGHNGIRCTSVPLEELFIELLGGDR